jgi:cytochrome c-type biogenesis protein CcmE
VAVDDTGLDNGLGLDDDLDLTPRTIGDAPPRRATRRSPGAYAVLALVVVAIGFVAFQFLNSAAVYYKNADEAVRDRASLGSSRFRIQGTVQPDVVQRGDEVDFTIAFNSVSVPVQHHGDPPDLFKPGLPVVLEGHWSEDGSVYQSDHIEVKHSAEYKEKNPTHVPSDQP